MKSSHYIITLHNIIRVNPFQFFFNYKKKLKRKKQKVESVKDNKAMPMTVKTKSGVAPSADIMKQLDYIAKDVLMNEVGNIFIECFERNIKDTAIFIKNVDKQEILIKKHKLDLLMWKECFIDQNPKLRKCLMTKYHSHLRLMMDYDQDKCEAGLVNEQDYIELCNFCKTALETIEHIHTYFGDKNNLDMEHLIQMRDGFINGIPSFQ